VLAYFNKAAACEKVGRNKEAVAAYKGFLQYAPPQLASAIDYAKQREGAWKIAACTIDSPAGGIANLYPSSKEVPLKQLEVFAAIACRSELARERSGQR